MKTRKRTFWSFREYEGAAFSGYLEEMAAAGRIIALTADGTDAAAGIGRMIPIVLSLVYILSCVTGSFFRCRRSETALASGELLPEPGMRYHAG